VFEHFQISRNARERRSGWRFPALVTDAHHAAFDRYLQDWFSSKINTKGNTGRTLAAASITPWHLA
jgi:hypothetical protein